MKVKTILIIVITALITIILMKNTDSVEFWIFGTYYIQKLTILATMFVLGIIVGLSLGRSSKRKTTQENDPEPEDVAYLETDDRSNPIHPPYEAPRKPLSDEDQNYIR